MDPILPEFDIREWRQKPWPTRYRMACQDWVVRGYGSPLPVYIFYVLKAALYVWLWSVFVARTPGLGQLADIGTWWAAPIAIQKAVLFSLLFEVVGLGCDCGPLAGRYNPPFGSVLHFLRPGTLKLPFFPRLPLLGGTKRTPLDVLLFAALLGALLYALLAPTLTPMHVAPVVALVLLCGVTDTTIFLSARAEHFLTAAICLLFADDWLAGLKWTWAAIWFWAAVSKLTPHFPLVVSVMQATSPLTHFLPAVRRAMFKSFPEDMHPSRLAIVMAHAGTVVELAIPLALLATDGGPSTVVVLGAMVAFHVFITSSFPLGVPIEWNIVMVYGGLALFGAHPEASALALSSPLLVAILAVPLVIVPLVGNVSPRHVSFLLSMRYYAGNWAYSVWLFKGDAENKLDQHITKAALGGRAQLMTMYEQDKDMVDAMLCKVPVFRLMHVQGRILHDLLPKACPDVEDYVFHDGEAVAGLVLGWNFGDGHLHQERLLEAIQGECQFEPGELRCIFVESQPIHRPFLGYRIHDAATGLIEEGEVPVKTLLARQPWPEGA
ncbi:MAG: DUF3556 domain-containing protein [Sandaracinaceae bacterium]|nr:DUF3556 domain-containing protein [Sandaracinaceae bacterium]